MACATRSTQTNDEGTYELSIDQLDLFLMSIELDHPSSDEFSEMLLANRKDEFNRSLKISAEEVVCLQSFVKSIPAEKGIAEQIARIALMTREDELSRRYVITGLSVRGAVMLLRAAQAFAVINGRLTPTGNDLERLLVPVLRHRIVLSFAGRAEGITVTRILDEMARHVF